jgi:hypothetical protein
MSLRENPCAQGKRWLRSMSIRNLAVVVFISALVIVGGRGVGASLSVQTVNNPKPLNSSTLFGRAVAIVGDINHDGVPDIAVGTPFQDGDIPSTNPGFGPPQNVGKVFILSGTDQHVLLELNDPEFQVAQARKFGGEFGASVASVGDINGDGVPDIIVGIPHHQTNVVNGNNVHIVDNGGRAIVFSGADGSVLHIFDDATLQDNARFGDAVSGLGDVNGDGVPDLLVGVPRRDVGSVVHVGQVLVYSGKDGSLIRTLSDPSPATLAQFGASVVSAGDINGDGISDIIVGAPGQNCAYVFSGANGSLLFTLANPVPQPHPSFGLAVAGGKDLNGDGVPDIVVSAPLLSVNGNNLQGRVFVFSGKDGTLIRTLDNPVPLAFSKFGASVALIPDVNGDGRADIMIGAPDQNVNGVLHAGEVFFFSGADGSVLQSLPPPAPQAFGGFGSAVAAADLDGDGTPDPVVGSPFVDLPITKNGHVETHLQQGVVLVFKGTIGSSPVRHGQQLPKVTPARGES